MQMFRAEREQEFLAANMIDFTCFLLKPCSSLCKYNTKSRNVQKNIFHDRLPNGAENR